MFRTEVDPDSPKGRPPCPTRIRRLTRMVGSTYTVLTLLLLSKSNLLKLTLLHIPRLWYMSRCCATYPASAYFSSPSRDWGHNHPEFSQAPSWDILRTSARLRWCRISRVRLSTCQDVVQRTRQVHTFLLLRETEVTITRNSLKLRPETFLGPPHDSDGAGYHAFV